MPTFARLAALPLAALLLLHRHAPGSKGNGYFTVDDYEVYVVSASAPDHEARSPAVVRARAWMPKRAPTLLRILF